MNPDVQGEGFVANIKTVLDENAAYVRAFNLVIAANLPSESLLQLASACWDQDIPLLVVRAYGMIGYVRVQTRCHDVVESKPDIERWDLRLDRPFAALEDYCRSFNLAELDTMEHKHVPFVVILWFALQQWRTTHAGRVPQSSEEKEQFKASIKAMSNDFRPADGKSYEGWKGGYTEEENFQEAVKEAYRVYTPLQLPSEVLELIEAAKARDAAPTDLCIFLRALARFVEAHDGAVPLSGQIPDMVSTTKFYIELQGVYRSLAESDKAAFSSLVLEELAAAGREASSLGADAVDTFCKNVFNVMRVSTRSIAEEHAQPSAEAVMMAAMDPSEPANQTPIYWYLGLRACDRFHDKNGRFPGSATAGATLESDAEAVWAELRALAGEYEYDLESQEQSQGQGLSREHAAEMARYGGTETHCIAALVGGIGAQEAVKLMTHQYVPVNNTYVYNGIACIGATYEL